MPVDGDGGAVDPAAGQQVSQPDVTVLGHQAVSSGGEGGGVQLKQRGQVIGVGDRDEVVDWLAGVTTYNT